MLPISELRICVKWGWRGSAKVTAGGVAPKKCKLEANAALRELVDIIHYLARSSSICLSPPSLTSLQRMLPFLNTAFCFSNGVRNVPHANDKKYPHRNIQNMTKHFVVSGLRAHCLHDVAQPADVCARPSVRVCADGETI